MGVSCSTDMEECSPKPCRVDADALTGNYDEREDGSRNLSASTLSLGSLLSWESLSILEGDSSDVGRNNDWNRNENEFLAQLWEDCYDLLELIEKTVKRVLRYQEGLFNNMNKLEEKQTCIELMKSIIEGLNSLVFEKVMRRLESAVFSTVKQENLSIASYIEITRQTEHALKLTLNQSFLLFLISWQNNMKIREDTSRVWNAIYKIHIDVLEIEKKFLFLILKGPSDSKTISKSYDLYTMFNNLHNMVRTKHLENPEKVPNLVARIIELQTELINNDQPNIDILKVR